MLKSTTQNGSPQPVDDRAAKRMFCALHAAEGADDDDDDSNDALIDPKVFAIILHRRGLAVRRSE